MSFLCFEVIFSIFNKIIVAVAVGVAVVIVFVAVDIVFVAVIVVDTVIVAVDDVENGGGMGSVNVKKKLLLFVLLMTLTVAWWQR